MLCGAGILSLRLFLYEVTFEYRVNLSYFTASSLEEDSFIFDRTSKLRAFWALFQRL